MQSIVSIKHRVDVFQSGRKILQHIEVGFQVLRPCVLYSIAQRMSVH